MDYFTASFTFLRWREQNSRWGKRLRWVCYSGCCSRTSTDYWSQHPLRRKSRLHWHYCSRSINQSCYWQSDSCASSCWAGL